MKLKFVFGFALATFSSILHAEVNLERMMQNIMLSFPYGDALGRCTENGFGYKEKFEESFGDKPISSLQDAFKTYNNGHNHTPEPGETYKFPDGSIGQIDGEPLFVFGGNRGHRHPFYRKSPVKLYSEESIKPGSLKNVPFHKVGTKKFQVDDFVKYTKQYRKKLKEVREMYGTPNGYESFDFTTNASLEPVGTKECKAELKKPDPNIVATFTDDTFMSLPVAEGLAEGLEHNDDHEGIMSRIARKFVDFYNHPEVRGGENLTSAYRRGVGKTCVNKCAELEKALKKPFWEKLSKSVKHLVFGSTNQWWKVGSPTKAGCGSVMRVAPVACALFNDQAKLEQVAIDQSNLTHGDPTATISSAAYATAIANIIRARKKSDTTPNMLEAITEATKVADKYGKKPGFNGGRNNGKLYKTQFNGKIHQLSTAQLYDHATAKANFTINAITSSKDSDNALSALWDNHWTNFGSGDIPSHEAGIKYFSGFTAADAIAGTFYQALVYTNPKVREKLGWSERKAAHMAIATASHTVGDSDSFGCMVGALMGAWSNKCPVKEKEIKLIENYDDLCKLGTRLAALNDEKLDGKSSTRVIDPNDDTEDIETFCVGTKSKPKIHHGLKSALKKPETSTPAKKHVEIHESQNQEFSPSPPSSKDNENKPPVIILPAAGPVASTSHQGPEQFSDLTVESGDCNLGTTTERLSRVKRLQEKNKQKSKNPPASTSESTQEEVKTDTATQPKEENTTSGSNVVHSDQPTIRLQNLDQQRSLPQELPPIAPKPEEKKTQSTFKKHSGKIIAGTALSALLCELIANLAYEKKINKDATLPTLLKKYFRSIGHNAKHGNIGQLLKHNAASTIVLPACIITLIASKAIGNKKVAVTTS
ncbi:ADP-ribosylglycohydrolase family protein [bacterium]|nr:ADP-ribosylglycohydrolase family protein [bacterium]